jgi:hypothetical protein
MTTAGTKVVSEPYPLNWLCLKMFILALHMLPDVFGFQSTGIGA